MPHLDCLLAAFATAFLLSVHAAPPGEASDAAARRARGADDPWHLRTSYPFLLYPSHPGGVGVGVGSAPLVVVPVSLPAPGQPLGQPGAPSDASTQQTCPQMKECTCDVPKDDKSNPDKMTGDGAGHEEGSLSFSPADDESALPTPFEPVASSQQLLEEFRAVIPTAPSLPPVLLSGADVSERARVPDGSAVLLLQTKDDSPRTTSEESRRLRTARTRVSTRLPNDQPPSTSYHAESLRMLRGKVTVRRADYTESYTAWYDEKTGNARVDFHGGSASSFRTTMPDKRVRRAMVVVQRAGARDLRRCTTTDATPDGASAPTRHPTLPDLNDFTFTGTEETPSGPVEVWKSLVKGRAGEQGAARGEVLTNHHELRLTRRDGDAVPLRYTVTVDSSALGFDIDGYEHTYTCETSQPIPPTFFEVDLEKVCDVVENLAAPTADDIAKLEPLREFTQRHRDTRYDQIFDRFQTEFSSKYADEREEAVRKNVLMQSTRFVNAGNRQGATFEMGTTMLADRLPGEVRRMMGAEGEAAALAADSKHDSFPYTRDEVNALDRRLPAKFDWRALGAVSPVGFQGEHCSSCWAFSVAGAVEGALFRRTNRLVPLSYKCLVDCAHPFGGKGCLGTWPSHAYNYVQERGLPALDEYPPYMEKVEVCAEQRVPSQTRISGHVNVTTDSVPALKVAIRKHAPTVVLVDAECKSFMFYKKGVLYDDRCGKALRQLHHAVLAVGWGERKGEQHFILKNSWSAKWGDNGYLRTHARSNTCGVLTMPTYPVLQPGDVRQPLRAGQQITD